MLNNIFSKEKFKSFDTIFGLSIFLLTTYLMFSSDFLGGGEAKVLDPSTLAEIRSSYYVGEEGVPTLVVFKTTWCGSCRSLERELTEHHLKFKTIDVEESREIYKLYQKVYGDVSGPVPVTVAGKRVIVGSRVDKIVEALAEKG